METIEFHVDDDGFVRAPALRCYQTLTDVPAWPSFWPRTRVEQLDDHRFDLRAGHWPRRLRLGARAGEWRHEQGFTFQLEGDLRGTWEIWLDPTHGGTVVHHVLAARGGRAWQLDAFRRWIRHGLWALKDLLQEEQLRALTRESRPPTGAV